MVSPSRPRQRRKTKQGRSMAETTGTEETDIIRKNRAAFHTSTDSDDVGSFNNMPRLRPLYVCVSITTVFVLILVVLLPVVVVDVKSTKNLQYESLSDNERITQSPRTGLGTFELLETVPHDSLAFTQGLLTITDDADGSLKFYEGTGLYGKSELRLVDISTGTVLSRRSIPSQYFGEGIAHYKDSNQTLRLIQLTWMEQTAFEYKLKADDATKTVLEYIIDILMKIKLLRLCWNQGQLRLCIKGKDIESINHSPLTVNKPISKWTYTTTTTEGWGITYSTKENHFLVTDGSHYLHKWDAVTRKEISKVSVTYQTANDASPIELSRLNELEWDPVTNTVLSNVWYQDNIVRIDPSTGFVRTIYNLASLFPAAVRPKGADVLNGIALTYDSLQEVPSIGTDQVWVTGKQWPYMYRIRLVDP
jgi:glutaminyl-peptide cyclotransferase